MPIKLIKDTILGNIVFSKFEGLLFSNQLFNRLHYITQNSMAFRVFPADRTARFLHSTGVMYLASEIFKNGLSNADHPVLNEFINEKGKLIQKIIDENVNKLPDMYPYNIRQTAKIKKRSTLDLLGDELKDILGDSFINHFVFFNDIFCEKEKYATYIILLIGIRAIGLLHDIGHLPFSHLSEYSLEDVLSDLQTKKEKGTNLNPHELSIIDMLNKVTESEHDKIHETVGRKLIELFFADLEEQVKADSTILKKEWTLLFLKVIKSLLLIIKQGKTGNLYSMYSIVASDFDADRIDFVMRDGLASGLIDKTGDVDRILKMYCLCFNPEKDKWPDKFIFLPSVQCQNDVQQILMDRYRIYKFLVNHHKVKKMDYIMQKALALLIETECSESNSQEQDYEFELKCLSDMVNVSANVLNTELNPDNIKRIKYQFSQLTENWAYSILNRRYIDLLINGDRGNSSFKALKLLFDEIFTGEKVFESLWKREHEYSDFVNALNNKLVDGYKKIFKEKIDSIRDTALGSLILKDIEEIDENLGKIAIRYLNYRYTGWQKDIEKSFAENRKIVLISNIKTSVGISDLSLVDLKNQNNTYLFKKISKAYDYLCLDQDSSPKFYVYYSNSGHNLNSNEIANQLIEYIIKYIID